MTERKRIKNGIKNMGSRLELSGPCFFRFIVLLYVKPYFSRPDPTTSL
jgi:hypothetical protein